MTRRPRGFQLTSAVLAWCVEASWFFGIYYCRPHLESMLGPFSTHPLYLITTVNKNINKLYFVMLRAFGNPAALLEAAELERAALRRASFVCWLGIVPEPCYM